MRRTALKKLEQASKQVEQDNDRYNLKFKRFMNFVVVKNCEKVNNTVLSEVPFFTLCSTLLCWFSASWLKLSALSFLHVVFFCCLSASAA